MNLYQLRKDDRLREERQDGLLVTEQSRALMYQTYGSVTGEPKTGDREYG